MVTRCHHLVGDVGELISGLMLAKRKPFSAQLASSVLQLWLPTTAPKGRW
jgi:hypothetical protein